MIVIKEAGFLCGDSKGCIQPVGVPRPKALCADTGTEQLNVPAPIRCSGPKGAVEERDLVEKARKEGPIGPMAKGGKEAGRFRGHSANVEPSGVYDRAPDEQVLRATISQPAEGAGRKLARNGDGGRGGVIRAR